MDKNEDGHVRAVIKVGGGVHGQIAVTDIGPGHFEGAVEAHEHPRSQPTDRTTP